MKLAIAFEENVSSVTCCTYRLDTLQIWFKNIPFTWLLISVSFPFAAARLVCELAIQAAIRDQVVMKCQME